MSAVVRKDIKHNSLPCAPSTTLKTSIQRTFFTAVHTASASELDLLLVDVRAEHAIRRMAREIADGEIHAGRLPLVLDLLRAARELCS